MREHIRAIARISGLIAALSVAETTWTEAALPPGNTVEQWNKIAEDTVLGAGAIQNEALLYMSYESAAVYDAVVAIEGGYQPYAVRILAHPGASADAAVIEAAYRILLHYFPAQAATLNAYRTEALAAVSDGSIPDGFRWGRRLRPRLSIFAAPTDGSRSVQWRPSLIQSARRAAIVGHPEGAGPWGRRRRGSVR